FSSPLVSKLATSHRSFPSHACIRMMQHIVQCGYGMNRVTLAEDRNDARQGAGVDPRFIQVGMKSPQVWSGWPPATSVESLAELSQSPCGSVSERAAVVPSRHKLGANFRDTPDRLGVAFGSAPQMERGIDGCEVI